MKIRPFGNLLVVLPDAAPQTTESGLYLPETENNKPKIGIVLAVGMGVYTEQGTLLPCISKVYDKILFPAYVGVPVELEGVKLLLIRESDVLGVIEKE